MTLESDKATMDVPAPSAGTVTQLAVKIGDRVSEGSVLLTLEENGAGPSSEPAGAGTMEAKVKAEHDEDERIRTEQARKAREIAEVLRTKVEADREAPEAAPARRRARRGGSLIKTAVFGVLAMESEPVDPRL